MAHYCFNCMREVDGTPEVCPHCGQRTQPEAAPHLLKPGTLLQDRYLIGKALGQGGFGITYIGLDTTLNTRIAVKEYYPNGYANRNTEVTDEITVTATARNDYFDKGLQRFLNEARILARFRGESGIVNVSDFFEANNTAYIVMEYLEGITLKQYVKTKGPIPAGTVLRLMQPVIRTLEKVHRQNVIHRDISPDNIMILRNRQLKLLDFGAAREVLGNKSLSVMLKPGYAPEEQYRSTGRQGPWTDVYALSATMYYCITGKVPEESMERIWNGNRNLPLPSELGAEIESWQEAAIMRGLAVKAENRFQDMRELGNALYDPESEEAAEAVREELTEGLFSEDGREEKPQVEAPVRPEKGKAAKQKKRTGLFVIPLLLILLGVGTFIAVSGWRGTLPTSDTATPSAAVTAPAEAVAGTSLEEAEPTASDTSAELPEATADLAPLPTPAAETAAPQEETHSSETDASVQSVLDGLSAEGWLRLSDDLEGNRHFEEIGEVWRQCLERAAELGQPFAAARLKVEQIDQSFDNEEEYSLEKLVNAWIEDADLGDDHFLSDIYYYTNESETAAAWWARAEEEGNSLVLIETAKQLSNTDNGGLENNYDRIMQLCERAASSNNPEILYKIGELFDDWMYGMENRDELALNYYQRAADLGNGDAMYRIGEMYRMGRGVEESEATAIEWWQKGAELESAYALYSLGDSYGRGAGNLRQNYTEARKCYLKAARLGLRDAFCTMGGFYESGYGGTQDYTMALEWYQVAESFGLSDASTRIRTLQSRGYV